MKSGTGRWLSATLDAVAGALSRLLGFPKQIAGWDPRFRALCILSFALGLGELGIMLRASEWMSPAQIGDFTAVYTVFLGLGNLLVGFSNIPTRRLIRIAIMVAAIPIAGIAFSVGLIPHPSLFLIAIALWAVSAVGSGAQDPAKNNAVVALERDTTNGQIPGGPVMLGFQYVAILFVSVVSGFLIAWRVPVPVEYLAIAALLGATILGTRQIPNSSGNQAPAQATAATDRSGRPTSLTSRLLLGFYQAFVLLPTSAGFGQIPDLMKALGASPTVASYATTAYVASAMVACLTWSRRETGHSTRRVALGGLTVALAGVALLTVSVLRFMAPTHLPATLAEVTATAGLAAVAWGVAPLVLIIFRAVGQPAQAAAGAPAGRRLAGGLFSVSLMTVAQDLGVAGGNAVLSALIGVLGQPKAFVLVVAFSVFALSAGILLIKEEWLQVTAPAPSPDQGP